MVHQGTPRQCLLATSCRYMAPVTSPSRSGVLTALFVLVASTASPFGAAADTAPGVSSFTLVDADAGTAVAGYDPIPQDAVLDLSALPARVNLRANTAVPVGSVRVKKDGGAQYFDNDAPYALVPDANGGFAPWTPVPGWHTAYATAFTQPDGQGTAGPILALRFQVVSTTTNSTPMPAPTVPPPPPPPPVDEPDVPPASPPDAGGSGGGGSACGPVPGATAGWQRRVTSTFNETTRLGAWPGVVAARDWRSRPAGYRDSSGRGTYNSAKTISERDGLLDIWIHSEGSTRYVAAPIPKLGDTFGQRIALCMRADRIPGYKIAFLLWPGVGPGNSHGEIDYPEGRLIADGTAHAFMHYDPKPSAGKVQDAFDTRISSVGWHSYVLEWDPGSPGSQADDRASFYLDGRLVGRSSGARVPDGPMHYIMQIETYVGGQAIQGHPEGHVLVDWVTIDVPR